MPCPIRWVHSPKGTENLSDCDFRKALEFGFTASPANSVRITTTTYYSDGAATGQLSFPGDTIASANVSCSSTFAPPCTSIQNWQR